MKAAVYTRYGPPEVVRFLEVEKPVEKDDEVLVRMYASTVNRTDTGFRSAQYVVSRLFSGLFRPKKQILGNEFAGVVEATGKDVHTLQVGDRVFGYDDEAFGAHAEYKVIKHTAAIAHIPQGLDFETAAAICEGAHYALCDIRAAKVSAGQQVLVNGATGAIGSAAIQLLRHFGADVVAVCETRHMELVRSLGADHVIDYTKDDFTAADRKFDFVFDAVGKSSFARCKKILKPKGIYISTELGRRSANVFLALLAPLSRGQKVLFPLPSISRQDVIFLRALVEQGKFRPVIDRVYPLADIVEAHRYVESGMKTGNVVISMPGIPH